jgi:hypothetical protein
MAYLLFRILLKNLFFDFFFIFFSTITRVQVVLKEDILFAPLFRLIVDLLL